MPNRALIVGVSNYPPGVSSLPAVTFDVAEISKLLSSSGGRFDPDRITILADADATKISVTAALRDVFGTAQPDDTLFVYLAGHGALDGAAFFFVTHDARLNDLAGTAVPLAEIKLMFDQCASERVLLWLDFCHSGGILERNLRGQETAIPVIERTLRIDRGHGKVIMCACTPTQSAYESGDHGHFTRCLLAGLSGSAANKAGEITASSLHDYIDLEMGSARQRPMFFGTMTGRIVLVASRKLADAEADALSSPTTVKLVVSDSGPWVLLQDLMFKASSVRQKGDGEIRVVIPSSSASDDAAIRAFKPEHAWGSKPIAFAHRNDGFLARVVEIENESTSTAAVWTVTLKSEQIQYGGGMVYDIGLQQNGRSYSADEIAELRARRLLLNDPPPAVEGERHMRGTNMLEFFIEGAGGGGLAVTESVFLKWARKINEDPQEGMQMARLAAIYALKASQVFEQVTELQLGPFENNKLHVKCSGRRRDRYVNRGPVVITIEGDCVLPEQ